jgi:hypothetical protein
MTLSQRHAIARRHHHLLARARQGLCGELVDVRTSQMRRMTARALASPLSPSPKKTDKLIVDVIGYRLSSAMIIAVATIAIAWTLFIRNNNSLSAKMSEQPTPVVFCGPSGVGKGTLIEMLMKRFPNDQFGFSVSHTTRNPREGEVNGTHYHFTTVEDIKKEIDAGKFVEYAEVRWNSKQVISCRHAALLLEALTR